MNSHTSLQRASRLADLLSAKLHEQPIPANLRNRIAGACFAIALEHQRAVVILFEINPPLNSSAFALVRPVFESYLRGMWLSHCATDAQLDAFSKDAKLPDTASLVNAVEKAGEFDGKQLSGVYKKHWSSFSSYTHTGALQVQRWNTSEAIEPSFTDEEISEVLEFTAALALLSAVSVAALANNEVLAQELLKTASLHAKK